MVCGTSINLGCRARVPDAVLRWYEDFFRKLLFFSLSFHCHHEDNVSMCSVRGHWTKSFTRGGTACRSAAMHKQGTKLNLSIIQNWCAFFSIIKLSPVLPFSPLEIHSSYYFRQSDLDTDISRPGRSPADMQIQQIRFGHNHQVLATSFTRERQPTFSSTHFLAANCAGPILCLEGNNACRETVATAECTRLGSKASDLFTFAKLFSVHVPLTRNPYQHRLRKRRFVPCTRLLEAAEQPEIPYQGFSSTENVRNIDAAVRVDPRNMI